MWGRPSVVRNKIIKTTQTGRRDTPQARNGALLLRCALFAPYNSLFIYFLPVKRFINDSTVGDDVLDVPHHKIDRGCCGRPMVAPTLFNIPINHTSTSVYAMALRLYV